jgi:Spy/CpxP family protein refolding chaperone
MKKFVAVMVALVFATMAYAQEQRRNMTFVERYGEQLKLTEEQKKVIGELDVKFQKEHEEFFEEMQKTMAEYRAARDANDQAKLDALKPKMDEQRAKASKLRAEHEEQIAKTFTDEQKATWAKIKEEREARMKERAQQQH